MDTKEILQDKAEADLEGLKAQIRKIQAKADKAKTEANTRYDEKLDELHRKQEQAEERLLEFRSASGESWRVFAAGLDDAITGLQNSVKEAIRWFE